MCTLQQDQGSAVMYVEYGRKRNFFFLSRHVWVSQDDPVHSDRDTGLSKRPTAVHVKPFSERAWNFLVVWIDVSLMNSASLPLTVTQNTDTSA